MSLDEKRVTIDYLRTQVTKLYAKSAYRLAAQRLRELEVLGARDASWWGYSLRLAAALGDVEIVNAAIIALAKEPEALLRGLRAAWANAVAQRHMVVAAAIDQHVRQLAPGDVEFRVLGLIDSLAGADPLNTNLQQLTATPLRMGTIDPRLLKTLIRALHGAGFGADARRMFDYYLMKHAPVAELDRQDTALLACEMKMFNLAMSLTANDADPKARYIHSLACHQEWAWSDCERVRLSSSELQALLDADPHWQPSSLFRFLMLAGYTDLDHLNVSRRAALAMQPERRYSHRPPPKRPKRLRVGYLSGDFKQHPSSQLACPALELHDNSRFEWIAFDNSRDDGSELRRRVLAAFDQVIAVRKMNDVALARAIREAHIDVLVDMSGHTNDSRVAVLAHRPAPVQITWLGYPGSLGRGLADYFVTDNICAPLGADRNFDETLIRLPVSDRSGGECINVSQLPERSACGLPDDATVLASFNQLAKVSKQTFDTWCEVLRVVPQSVLWLFVEGESPRKRIAAAMNSRGIDASRVFWASRAPYEAHVARLGCADIILDCHPYTMHTTAADALVAGVPYLTYCGETLASRVSSSLLHTAGLADCVCADPQEYRRRLLDIATDSGQRAMLRARFALARTQSRLFDSRQFAFYLVRIPAIVTADSGRS